MKIEPNRLILNAKIALLLGALFVVSPSITVAQTATPVSGLPSPTAQTPGTEAAPQATLSEPQVSISSPPISTDPALSVAVMPAKEEKKGLAGAEDKVSDSVKALAKRMGNTDSITLDDLNSARQAVAKIDALIDIEKHLRELEKLRAERDDSAARSLSSALPASALSPFNSQAQVASALPLPMPSPVAMPAGIPQNPMSSLGDVTVSRITGSGGRFTAAVKTSDGQTKNVQVGDKLNGGTVSAITSSGVEINHNKSIKVYPVKNVPTVFGNTP